MLVRRVLSILLLVTAFGGCTAYKDPTLKIVGARVLDQTDEAIQLGFTVEMYNPNEEPLELLIFRYNLRVDGRAVYDGIRAAEATLGRKSTRYAMLPAVVRYDKARWEPGVMPDVFDYRLGGQLEYVTPGEIAELLLDSGLRRPKVTFAAIGRVEAEDEGGEEVMAAGEDVVEPEEEGTEAERQ